MMMMMRYSLACCAKLFWVESTETTQVKAKCKFKHDVGGCCIIQGVSKPSRLRVAGAPKQYSEFRNITGSVTSTIPSTTTTNYRVDRHGWML